jgi:hypothetical protein
VAAQPAFGVDQEITSSHNALSALESTLDNDASGTVSLDGYIPPSVATIRSMDKYIRCLARID